MTKNTPTADQDVERLLSELSGAPRDEGLRERAARALERAGRYAEAHDRLREELTNLTAHEEGPLPCLCRRCIAPERVSAEAEGSRFYREFSVASGRVLFYWVLDEVPRRKALALAVEAKLRENLAEADRKRRRR